MEGTHLEEAVGVHVVHVHIDHSEQAFDLLEAHLIVLVGVCPVQVGVDPGVGAQEIPAIGWALPLADRQPTGLSPPPGPEHSSGVSSMELWLPRAKRPHPPLSSEDKGLWLRLWVL